MTDRPILFSGAMVRALLDGRKTQTRRVLKPQPVPTASPFYRPYPIIRPHEWHSVSAAGYTVNIQNVRYAPGDLLWVREGSDDVHPLAVPEGRFSIEGRAGIPGPPSVKYRRVYRADGDVLQVWHTSKGHPFRTLDGPEDEVSARHPEVCSEWVGRLKYQPWQPSIHMPRWASRLTLEVTDVRVERLQEISEEDARAEGVLYVPGHGEITYSDLRCDPGYSNFLNCRMGFGILWDSLNEKRATWESNPWVVAISFTVHRQNIDALKAERAAK